MFNDETNENFEQEFPNEEAKANDGDASDTTAGTRDPGPEKEAYIHRDPYIYSTIFNKKQDLLFASGAGRNEMRIFDWDSGSIVAMVSNIPRAILCADISHKSNIFAFGA